MFFAINDLSYNSKALYVFFYLEIILLFTDEYPVVSTPPDLEAEEFSSLSLECTITGFKSYEVNIFYLPA